MFQGYLYYFNLGEKDGLQPIVFMFAFRLFSEIGDFSSDEVKFFNKCLQKESKQIDSFESSIKADVEKIKSSCLEQVCRITLSQIIFSIDIFAVSLLSD